MKTLQVRRLLVATDGSAYGRGIAHSVVQQAASFGVRSLVVRNRILTADPALATELQASRADAIFFGGSTSAAAVELWDRVAAIAPQMKLFGPSGLDNDSFAAAIDLTAQQETFLSEPSVSQGGLPPAGQDFQAGFTAEYGRPPRASAFFGYAALQAVLDSIHLAGRNGGRRALVAKRFFGLNDTASILGNYSVTSDGNTTIPPYFRFSRVTNGQRVFDALVLAHPRTVRRTEEPLRRPLVSKVIRPQP
jgi:ABC-type branched-subunit amino acid transport system substrate-binding protein